MLFLSLYTMLKLSKTTSLVKLFPSDHTVYVYLTCLDNLDGVDTDCSPSFNHPSTLGETITRDSYISPTIGNFEAKE